jgi:hypothetical protein
MEQSNPPGARKGWRITADSLEPATMQEFTEALTELGLFLKPNGEPRLQDAERARAVPEERRKELLARILMLTSAKMVEEADEELRIADGKRKRITLSPTATAMLIVLLAGSVYVCFLLFSALNQ